MSDFCIAINHDFRFIPPRDSLLLLELGATSRPGSLQINVEMVVRVA